MTRAEQKKEKLKQEQDFIKSIKGKKINGELKGKFRRTTAWLQFRDKFKNTLDVITLRKLPKRFQLHHLDLNSEHYTDLKENRFVGLNGTTHDIVHYLYGYYRNDKDILKRLKKVLDLMVKINEGKDIRDFK